MTHMTPECARRIRRKRGMSQSEMCAALRIEDRATIYRWEKGERPVSGPASIVLEMIDEGIWPR